MKILILNKMYHPDIGGVETITKQYAEWLNSDNHTVTILTTSSKSNFKIVTKTINGVKVISHSPLFVVGSLPVSIFYLLHYFLIYPLRNLSNSNKICCFLNCISLSFFLLFLIFLFLPTWVWRWYDT